MVTRKENLNVNNSELEGLERENKDYHSVI